MTSEELVLMYTENISLHGQQTNTVLKVNLDALLIAQALDFERRQTGSRSALHGIPVLLKDNMDTADKMHTSVGSWTLKDHYALRDAKVVDRLRQAGAVILGKFHVGYHDKWLQLQRGQVKNQHGSFDVGGSSSGSAAAIASNLAAGAIGTETSGSIINPAVQTSLVGIKPTVGLASRSGIVPLSHTQDVPGPLARTVADAVALFEAIVGVDSEDSITLCAAPFESYEWKKHWKH